MSWEIRQGDSVAVMATLDAESVDAVVTDPPYGLEFMGKEWDRLGDIGKTSHAGPSEYDGATSPWPRVAYNGSSNRKCGTCRKWEWDYPDRKCTCAAPDFPNAKAHQGRLMQTWHEAWAREAYRVLKPGGHLLAFSGTRTYHRMASGIEDAGFEVRDQLAWCYGSGFPKSLDVGKAIDAAAGATREVVGSQRLTGTARGHAAARTTAAEPYDVIRTETPLTAPATDLARQWDGWGTALKPAWEPIVVARKPLRGTVAANVAQYGTGGINVDGCRIAATDKATFPAGVVSGTESVFGGGNGRYGTNPRTEDSSPLGRWPANLVLGCACDGDHDPACASRKAAAITTGVNRVQFGANFRDDDWTPPDEHTTAHYVEQPCDCGWRHDPACAVAVLDAQSGERRSAGDYPSASTTNNGVTYGIPGQQGQLYGDTGGASRFMKIARARYDLLCGACLTIIEPCFATIAPPTSSHVAQPPASAPDVARVSGSREIEDSRASSLFGVDTANGSSANTPAMAGCSVPPSAGTSRSAPSDPPVAYVDYQCGICEMLIAPASVEDSRSRGETLNREAGRIYTSALRVPTSPPGLAWSAERTASNVTIRITASPSPSSGSAIPATVEYTVAVKELVPSSRFRYDAKASRGERERGLDGLERRDAGVGALRDGERPTPTRTRRNTHPTVKPIDLMQWLCRLVTPPGGLVLDPFVGSGTTGAAALREGFRFLGIDQDAEYVEIARRRIVGDAPMFNGPAMAGGA